MTRELSVGIVGATGAVGREMVRVLEQRNFPVGKLVPFASARSRGKTVRFRGEEIPVTVLSEETLPGLDLYLFSAGASVSREFAPVAARSGIVVDNSSAFRMDPGVPLVVPEVNPDTIADHAGIIANPNCSTIQMVVAINPLHQAFGLKRVIVATYQSVSGTGLKAIDELDRQVRDYVEGREPVPSVYPYPIAFNLIPHIDVFFENGYTKEEMKMVDETRKIMNLPDLKICATCVRVPVFRCHSEAVVVETEKPVTVSEARSVLANAPGVEILDDPEDRIYPTPRELAGTDKTYVGRIREALAFDNGIAMWIVADQLRKGAALNAVQIAELLLERGLL